MANKISTFLQAVRAEMKKVTWPSRPRIIRSTLIVLITIAIFGIFIGGIDFMFFQILKFFLG
jgi:preprotein translocase subunit SecE